LRGHFNDGDNASVIGRKKEHDNFYAQASDFDLGPAPPVDAAQILSETGWAPYAIDAEARKVSFARMPANVDLHSAPFVPITEDIASALRAFDKDSQEGTLIARKENKKRLTPEERASYLATLARVPAFADPDIMLKDVYSS
jgi:hypothetical protein